MNVVNNKRKGIHKRLRGDQDDDDCFILFDTMRAFLYNNIMEGWFYRRICRGGSWNKAFSCFRVTRSSGFFHLLNSHLKIHSIILLRDQEYNTGHIAKAWISLGCRCDILKCAGVPNQRVVWTMELLTLTIINHHRYHPRERVDCLPSSFGVTRLLYLSSCG